MTETDIDDLSRFGTDADFRKFIQRQPSCLSGQFSEWVDGEGRCVAAHVRRSATSGTGFKAPYSCVPLTQNEHLTQHQKGELQALLTHGDRHGIYATPEFAKEWFDAQVEKYRRLWIESVRGQRFRCGVN